MAEAGRGRGHPAPDDLLVLNLLLMVLLVWASAGSDVLFRIVSLVGAIGWIGALALLLATAAPAATRRQQFKLAAGTLAIVPAWCALVLLHGQPHGNRWLLTALALVWAADSGAYFAGRHFGGTSWRRASAPTRPWKACSGAGRRTGRGGPAGPVGRRRRRAVAGCCWPWCWPCWLGGRRPVRKPAQAPGGREGFGQ
jgi:hypothetical protein